MLFPRKIYPIIDQDFNEDFKNILMNILPNSGLFFAFQGYLFPALSKTFVN